MTAARHQKLFNFATNILILAIVIMPIGLITQSRLLKCLSFTLSIVSFIMMFLFRAKKEQIPKEGSISFKVPQGYGWDFEAVCKVLADTNKIQIDCSALTEEERKANITAPEQINAFSISHAILKLRRFTNPLVRPFSVINNDSKYFIKP